jgi:hypothetical protein
MLAGAGISNLFGAAEISAAFSVSRPAESL